MADNKSLVNDMTSGPLFKQLTVFSLPIILGNILQACYTITDMVIVGNFIGADGLSAVGIGGILQHLLLMAGMGLGFGGQILLSQQVGAGDRDSLKKTIGTFMTMTLASAVVLGAAGAGLVNWLLNILNAPEAVYNQTRSYHLVCCSGIVFIYGYNCVCAILRGLGESRLPTVFIAIAAVINIALDCFFIGVLGMNVEGAALATVIAQGVSFIASLVYLVRHKEAFGFDFKPKSFIPGTKTILMILKLALPLMILGFLMSIANMFINSNVNYYGVAASAVDGIGSKLNMMANSITMGLYTGGGAIIGQCFGAGKTERIRSVFKLTIVLSLIIWAVIAGIMLIFAKPIFRIFTPDAEVLAMAQNYMWILVVFFLGMALATGPFALFEGVGNTNAEMWVGIAENLIVKIGLGIILSRAIGLYGYWLGCSLAAFTTPIAGFIYFFSGLWAKRKVSLPVE